MVGLVVVREEVKVVIPRKAYPRFINSRFVDSQLVN